MSIRNDGGTERGIDIETTARASVALCRACDAFKVSGECPNCDGGA
jgi:hypothetical protein